MCLSLVCIQCTLSCLPLPTPKEITTKFFSGFPLQLLILWDTLPLSFFFRRESINLFTFGTRHRVGNFMCCCHVCPHCVLLIIVIWLVILAIFAAFDLTNMCVDIEVLCSVMFPDMSSIVTMIFTNHTFINPICMPLINVCSKILLGVTSPATVTSVLWGTLGYMSLSVIKRVIDIYIVDIILGVQCLFNWGKRIIDPTSWLELFSS